MVKNPPASAGDLGSIPGLGKSPREGNGYPLQYSCLEDSMDRGAWQAMVPWRRYRLPTPVFWPGEFHGQRTLAGSSPQGHKESDVT